MALLVGQQTAGGGVLKAFASEKAEAWKFTAAHTGTVEEIEIVVGTGESTATSVKVAVMTNSAGVPGTIIGSEVLKSEKPAESAAYKVPGLSSAVTESTEYWLVCLPLGGNIRVKEGVTTGFSKSTGAVSEISKAAWTASENKGPVGIAGVGTESGGALQVASTIKIKLKDTALAEQTQLAAVVSQIRLKDSVAMAQALSAGATVQVRLKDTASLGQALAVAAVSKVVLKGSASPQQTVSVAAIAQVRFKGTANVTLAETGGRRIAIFVFDE